MYTLKNTDLTISILDPVADVVRLGSRYCTGGYIYQVTDAAKGKLLSGPQYPAEYPDVFDGQGAPDMFLQALGAETAPVGGEVGCIGVGRVRRTSEIEPFSVRHNPEVIEFVQWQVEQTAASITMQTEASFQAWAYRLTRQITLSERTIHSRTEIANTGQPTLPVRWFPHPFFPLTDDGVLCHFSIPVSLPENPGYALNDAGFICRKPDHDWVKGWFQRLDYEADAPGLTIIQKHPLVGQVVTQLDYPLALLPIWGNARTFSFEPYLDRQLQAGEQATWQISYTF